jgi:hypothetical protein
VIVGIIIIIVCINKRKANLRGMERKIQMDLKPEPRSDLKSSLNTSKQAESVANQ